MAKIPSEIGLTADEIEELMTTTWNLRVATVGPGDRINLTPMWFGWGGGRIYFHCRGQKVANLRRNPRATVLVDRNERFPELQAVMFQGSAAVLEDADAERADPHLEAVRWQMGTKYAGGHGEPPPEPGAKLRNNATARGRGWRWVVFTPDSAVSWDNTKLRRGGDSSPLHDAFVPTAEES
jgi:nitroimidazol reductase NimA-like FMN-containing flavoprotein (pyridoxamine 5'-phosphate oxidase superfamily)